MIIEVTYDSEILGSGVFWEGTPDKIHEIRNIPARNLAQKVVNDGETRTSGMWTVKVK